MENNAAKVIKHGETTFIFHDDYCRERTQENVKVMLERVSAVVLPALNPSGSSKKISING